MPQLLLHLALIMEGSHFNIIRGMKVGHCLPTWMMGIEDDNLP